MKKRFTRREFILTSTSASLALSIPFDFKRPRHLLAFSTLACPDWHLEKIVNFAEKHEYSGIEIRGILKQMNLPKCPEFRTEENILAVNKLIKEKKIRVIGLGSSISLHHANKADREKNIVDGKSFIDLANKLNCPFIRVFPESLPKEQDRNETLTLIAKGLIELGDYAKDKNVKVLMETHGDVVESKDLENVMQITNHPNAGLVWDVVNMWWITKEPVEEVYARLKKYIYHVHIKDLKLVNGKEQYVLPGKGDTPIFKAIDLLAKDKYKGYYSFEWEKFWHPEIEEPEIALSAYPKIMKKWLRKIQL